MFHCCLFVPVVQPVGIANTVTRYHESRPLRPHVTPFEARLEAKIAEEEVAAAVAASEGQPVLPCGTNSTKKQLFNMATVAAEQH